VRLLGCNGLLGRNLKAVKYTVFPMNTDKAIRNDFKSKKRGKKRKYSPPEAAPMTQRERAQAEELQKTQNELKDAKSAMSALQSMLVSTRASLKRSDTYCVFHETRLALLVDAVVGIAHGEIMPDPGEIREALKLAYKMYDRALSQDNYPDPLNEY
jgi:hypothetical protein